MDTKSFYETMVIDTSEVAANIEKAIEDYVKYRPNVPVPTKGVSEGPDDLDRFTGVTHRTTRF